MKTLRTGLLSLLFAASVLPVSCGKSGHAVSHDGAAPASDSALAADTPLGSGGGIAGASGTRVAGTGGGTTAGTGGTIAGTGGATVGTGGTIAGTGGVTAGTGGTIAGTGGAIVSSGGSRDAGADATLASEVGGGTVDTGGSRDGGSGGAPGLDGPALASCPSAAPRDGDPCGAAEICYYEDCAGTGRTVASCANDSWTVTVGTCKTATCRSGTAGASCDAGQLCLAIASGVPIALCAPNTCGTGPVSCSCLQSCTGVCTVRGTATDGLIVSCNPCPAGGCQ